MLRDDLPADKLQTLLRSPIKHLPARAPRHRAPDCVQQPGSCREAVRGRLWWRTSWIFCAAHDALQARCGDVHVIDFVIVQVLLLAFSLSELAFGTLVASVFSRAKIAAIVGPLLHFCLLLPR